MENQVILLDYWPSPYAARVRIALAEKGIQYESKDEDLANKSPLLMEMNPVHQKVPVLIHNGKPICESDVIIQYLDDVWKDESPPLFPSNPYLKAKARFWNHFISTKVSLLHFYFPGSFLLFSFEFSFFFLTSFI